MAVHPAHRAAPALQCAHCGEPIGVYEPLVYLDASGGAVHSAYLRLPGALRASLHATPFFHVACYA